MGTRKKNDMSDPSEALGLAMCKALNIEPDQITSISIEANVGEIPRAHIVRLLKPEEIDPTITAIKHAVDHYKLVTQLHPYQCSSRAPRLDTLCALPSAETRCILDLGHDGWHSDGTEPLPMRWNP